MRVRFIIKILISILSIKIYPRLFFELKKGCATHHTYIIRALLILEKSVKTNHLYGVDIKEGTGLRISDRTEPIYR